VKEDSVQGNAGKESDEVRCEDRQRFQEAGVEARIRGQEDRQGNEQSSVDGKDAKSLCVMIASHEVRNMQEYPGKRSHKALPAEGMAGQ
jgi:hypothetical protein